jgi:hypothetical protein
MTKINESQTQVLLNGGIIPQHQNDNLITLTAEFFKSGKTDAQVLAILCGMGVPQPWAEKAISEYAKLKGMTENTNNQKNQTKMQFTLTELYGRVMDTLNKLKEMKAADSGRVSYSADQAIRVLEGTLSRFPVSLKNADLKEVSEEIENSASPMLKFSIAKELHRGASTFEWVNPIKEMLNYIESVYTNNTLYFQVSEACDTAHRKGGKLYERLGNDLSKILTESSDNIKNAFLAVSSKHPWSPECKSILESISVAEQKVYEQEGGKIVNILSPVISEGEKHTFHLFGKNYTTDGKTVSETAVNDSRYNAVLEGLNICSREGDELNIYGQNDKTFTINLVEGKINLGEIDLTNSSVIEIKESLLGTNFFNYRENYKIDTVCRLVENFDMVAEMDDILSINSLTFPSLFLTMISVEEGVYMNKINGGMKMNEMKFYSSASEAVKAAKEFIGYDVSLYVAEKLEAEGNLEIRNTENRKKIQEMIDFLESKKSEITSAITRVGETPELKEALDLVSSEIETKEKELQSTFISEKKSKTYYLNQGYVEGDLASDIDGMKKGQQVMVNAEDYSKLGDEELIDVIDPKTDKSTYVRKDALEVKI